MSKRDIAAEIPAGLDDAAAYKALRPLSDDDVSEIIAAVGHEPACERANLKRWIEEIIEMATPFNEDDADEYELAWHLAAKEYDKQNTRTDLQNIESLSKDLIRSVRHHIDARHAIQREAEKEPGIGAIADGKRITGKSEIDDILSSLNSLQKWSAAAQDHQRKDNRGRKKDTHAETVMLEIANMYRDLFAQDKDVSELGVSANSNFIRFAEKIYSHVPDQQLIGLEGRISTRWRRIVEVMKPISSKTLPTK